MNTDHIQDIITAVKNDKSIVQPWRNKAIARLEEAIAFVEKGQRTTNLKPPVGLEQTSAGGFSKTGNCTCPHYPEAQDSTCPIHHP